MPVTEILILSFKQDDATREGFTSTLIPTMSKIMVGKPGLIVKPHSGQMLSANGKDTSSTFQPVFGLGWSSPADFMAVIKGPDFETFRPIVHPLVSGPPAPPELYNTDVGPKEVFGSALTEVFRVTIGEDAEKEATATKTWGDFVKGIGASTTLSGVSVNVETKTFLGAIGWESEEARKSAHSKTEAAFLKLGELDTFVAALKEV